MARTTSTIATPGFVVDPASLVRDGGHQIDWANVADSYKNAQGRKELPAGTVIGELLGNGKISPRVATTNPASGILATAAVEGEPTAAKSGYGVIIGGVLFENLLPDASGSPKVLSAAIKTELKANGYAWAFKQYADSRAS